jgi:hypothetical protein
VPSGREVAGGFELGIRDQIRWVALMLLLIRVKWFVDEQMKAEFLRPIVDEGRFRAGTVVKIPGLHPPLLRGEIVFSALSDIHPLQLADFAAFSLNRTQLLLGLKKLSYWDAKLLQILTPIAPLFTDLKVRETTLDECPPFSSEELKALTDAGVKPGVDK